MKILHITFSLTNGGVENLLVDVANLQALENDVRLIIINDHYEKDLMQRISSHIRLKLYNRRPGSPFILAAFQIFLFILRNRPDIIHIHIPKLIVPTFFFRKKVVCTIHNVKDNSKLIRFNRHLIAISKSVKNDMKVRYQKESTLIYNAIDTRKVVSKTLSPNGIHSFKIVQVSRLNHVQKGQDILIKAFKHISGLNSDVTLTLIGDGASKQSLESLIRSENLQDRIEMIGNKDREWIYNNLHQYDIFIQPSRFEGFGLTVVEAILSGLPVIVSNVDGPMEIIENGRYGLYFENENVNDLSEKIRLTIANYNSDEFKNKLTEARQHCSDTFDINTHVEQLSRLYGEILSKN
jgi:glycosyltransferase involved in cell wall biosynthesis